MGFSGRFSTGSFVLGALSMILWLPSTALVYRTDDSLKRYLIFTAIMIPIWIFSRNIPARFTADEKDFEIRVGLKKRHFFYSEISSIECEYDTDANTTVLTVCGNDGRFARFTEDNYYNMDDIEYRPEIAKPQLMQLYEYIIKHRGGNGK